MSLGRERRAATIPVTQEETNRAKLSYSAHHACKVIPALERIIIINTHTHKQTQILF